MLHFLIDSVLFLCLLFTKKQLRARKLRCFSKCFLIPKTLIKPLMYARYHPECWGCSRWNSLGACLRGAYTLVGGEGWDSQWDDS